MSEDIDEEFYFTCEKCGKDFEPDPSAILQVGFRMRKIAKEEIGNHNGYTADQLRRMSEYELGEINLTPETRDKLLNGEEFVMTGARCICPECLDMLTNEREGEGE